MGLAAAAGSFGTGIPVLSLRRPARLNCSGFSFYLACHFTLPFAVGSVRSGEREISGATRSSNPFWILLMPHPDGRAGHLSGMAAH
jgi:hypothetical protein